MFIMGIPKKARNGRESPASLQEYRMRIDKTANGGRT